MATRTTADIVPIELGPFVLERRLGQGAMGEVWRGRHAEQDIPVAIKVVTGELARDARYRSAFRDEVRAAAALNHPGIVMVLDFGAIPEDAFVRSERRLVPGSPWFAMELASHGSLETASLPMRWPDLKGVLLTLLDALSHAHARGVIHRDLKPGNVLVAGPEDLRGPGLRLTDFGIAHARDKQERKGSIEVSVGTPHYMAPEQVEGRFRDYGPWTDLYSLGVMAFELASGRLPFDDRNVLRLAMRHLSDPVPRLPAGTPLPAGFESWVVRLLAKDADRRFHCAADAAWALLSLGDPEGFSDGVAASSGSVRSREAPQTVPDVSSVNVDTGEGATDDGRETILLHSAVEQASESMSFDLDTLPSDGYRAVSADTMNAPPSDALLEREGAPSTVAPVELRTPPIPKYWSRPVPTALPTSLVGAGLELFGLRAVPLVGRQTERDVLWQALRDVAATERPRLVHVHGPAGVGKSRLIEWMCERVAETGAGVVLSSSHSSVPTPTDGLARMAQRHYQCLGLTHREIIDRVRKRLEPYGYGDYEWHALAELMEPASSAERAELGTTVRFTAPTEWYALLDRMLRRAVLQRPAVVVLDDVQWGLDAIGFARYLLGTPPGVSLPVLIVTAARDEALAERPEESRALTALLRDQHATPLPLSPLGDDAMRSLVDALLDLDPELRTQVCARTSGNPLFAVQLLGDWVSRGVLATTRDGFVLRDGVPVSLPDDVHQVWHRRIARATRGLGPTSEVLEIAAIIGSEVDPKQWYEAVAAAGYEIPADLVNRLATAHLVVPTDTGWAFAHNMLRESLERTAREEGRLVAHHRAVAQMLETVDDGARLAHHLAEARLFDKAVLPLTRATRRLLQRGQLPDVEASIARLHTLSSAAALPNTDPRCLEVQLIEARLAEQRGNYDRAASLASEISTLALGGDEPRRARDALLVLASVHRNRAELDAARQALAQAAAVATRGKLGPHTPMQLQWAEVERSCGNLQRAEELAREAIAASVTVHHDDDTAVGTAAGTAADTANCHLVIARILRTSGDLEAAAHHYQDAHDNFVQYGSHVGIAASLNGLGELRRARGDLEAAAAAYREAADVYESIGASEGVFPRWNLALVEMQLRNFADAERGLHVVLGEMERLGRKAFVGFINANLTAVDAAFGRWEDFERRLNTARQALDESPMADADIAWPLELAAELASNAGESDSAVRALLFAREQWERLNRPDKLAAVDAALQQVHQTLA